MDIEIKSFINLIKEKTGISVELEDSPVLGIAKENPFVDGSLGKTFFSVKVKNESLCFSILGASDVEKTYANLILELAESSLYKEVELTFSEFYKGALYGELSNVKLRKYVSKFGIPETPCYVMILTCEKGNLSDAESVIDNYGDSQNDVLVQIEKGRTALVKFVDEKSRDYRSSREYAEFLVQTVYEETGVDLSVAIGGTVDNVYSLAKSCAQAFTVLRMTNDVSLRGKIHAYNEYTLFKILEDIPKHKTGEYLDALSTPSSREIFADKELLETAEEFLENSLNISETARKLYLHRNTLSYRLEKIEKGTGLDIRKFSDAVTFRIMWALSVFLNK